MTSVPIVLSLLCIYVTLSVLVVSGESTFTEEDLRDVQHPRFRRNPRLCGTVLLTALSSVCDSTYNSPPNKRTGSFAFHQRHNSHNELFDMGAPGKHTFHRFFIFHFSSSYTGDSPSTLAPAITLLLN